MTTEVEFSHSGPWARPPEALHDAPGAVREGKLATHNLNTRRRRRRRRRRKTLSYAWPNHVVITRQARHRHFSHLVAVAWPPCLSAAMRPPKPTTWISTLSLSLWPLLFAVFCSLPRVCNRGQVGGKGRSDVGELAAMWRWRIMGRVSGSEYW